MIRQTALILSVVFSAGILFVNIYTSVVDAPNWGHHFPDSVEIARQYFAHSNPGNFFRIFSPANQILALLAVILCWKVNKQIRMFTLVALFFSIIGDVFTFAYFYPRNDIIFTSPIDSNIEAIKTAWKEWTAMNWLRSGIALLNVIFSFSALVYLLKPASR